MPKGKPYYQVYWGPKEPIENMTKFLWDINKYPYSKSKRFSPFAFSVTDMQHFIKELNGLIERLKKILMCKICSKTVTEAIIPYCDCQTVYCRSCWVSDCTVCGKHLDKSPARFKQVDQILENCQQFLSRNFRNFSKAQLCLKVIAEMVRECEMNIMCNYCFGYLTTTIAVKRQTELSLCCRGCDQLYIQCYGQQEEPIQLNIF